MEVFSVSLSQLDVILCLLVALMIGMSRAGVPGLGLAAVPLLASVFGGKPSAGVLLPVLCFADIFAVIYYRRHAQWAVLFKLIPSAIVGIVMGVLFGHIIDDHIFRLSMGIIILISLALMLYSGDWLKDKLKTNPSTASFLGISGGFTSMVGNLAGPILSLYMMAMQFPKKQFIGTAAWFFMVLNLLKLPGHIWVWKTISLESFILDLFAIPAILVGAFLGVLIVNKISESYYRWFIILTILVSSILLFI